LRLAWVELRDFRNHEQTRLDDIPEGLVTLVGPNGEGKTNMLEGIAFLFLLESPRASSFEPLVRRGALGSAYARGEVETGDGRVLVEVEIPGRAEPCGEPFAGSAADLRRRCVRCSSGRTTCSW
jgi:DNA replication and repair protein RecF